MSVVKPRKLGASDVLVPAMGVGTQQWGEERWGFGTTHSRNDLKAVYRMLASTASARPMPMARASRRS
jgi:aryl-alcohol dehydrogenase-like predicted oxidoreductase